MDSYNLISLVDYINLLHSGHLDRALFSFYEKELKNCSPFEVNLAIENLIVRHSNIDDVEMTIARFIRAVAFGLDKIPKPVYRKNSIFCILDEENTFIHTLLQNIKMSYLKKLPALKTGNKEIKSDFKKDIEAFTKIRPHYLKLQYGLFSALESVEAPTLCIKLMWHLQNSIWDKQRECLELIESENWDFDKFNKIYGQMFFRIGSLLYREEKILFPVAYDFLPDQIQKDLIKEIDVHGAVTI